MIKAELLKSHVDYALDLNIPPAFLKAFTRGAPVYYMAIDTPEGCMIKEYPTGQKEIVMFDADGNEHIYP